MSAASAPFGFRPAYHSTGIDRDTKYAIAAAYGTAMYEGQPCILDTNGTVTVGTAAADLLGVFMGCEYIDATGKPNVSTFWPAAQTVQSGSVPTAWVTDDPNTVFEVQADGSIAQTAIGAQSDVSNVGSNLNGRSQATLSASVAAGGAQAQFRIIGFGQQLDNAPGDAFTIVQVKIARHQFVSNKVGI